MIEQRKRHFLIFLPVWIIPVFLITCGSLINFHQNKIWGKQLMPYSYIAPRDKAKVVKIQDVKNHISDFIAHETVNQIAFHQPFILFDEFSHSEATGLCLLFSSGLRAPPLS